jgi:hypothetical protein
VETFAKVRPLAAKHRELCSAQMGSRWFGRSGEKWFWLSCTCKDDVLYVNLETHSACEVFQWRTHDCGFRRPQHMTCRDERHV